MELKNYDNKYIRKYECNFIASGFDDEEKEIYNKKIKLNHNNNKFIAIIENIKIERKLREINNLNLFFIDDKRRIGLDSRTDIQYLNKTILIGFDTEIELKPINNDQPCFLTLLSNNPFDTYILSKKDPINSDDLQKNLLIYSGKIDEEETELMVYNLMYNFYLF